MPRIIANGTLGPIPGPNDFQFDPVRGLVTTLEWKGVGPESLAGLANYCRGTGIAFDFEQSGVVSKLRAHWSGGTNNGYSDAVQFSWQLLNNALSQSIWSSDYFLRGVAQFPTLRQDVEFGWRAIQEKRFDIEADFRDQLPDDGEIIWYDELIAMFNLGIDSVENHVYVLRRSISASNYYFGAIPGEELVDHTLSTGALLLMAEGMPAVLSQKISSIPFRGDFPDGYAWGWRQLPSNVTQAADNRVEITTEWTLLAWRESLYPFVA